MQICPGEDFGWFLQFPAFVIIYIELVGIFGVVLCVGWHDIIKAETSLISDWAWNLQVISSERRETMPYASNKW